MDEHIPKGSTFSRGTESAMVATGMGASTGFLTVGLRTGGGLVSTGGGGGTG
jgi:hypothetical protein